MDLSNKSLGILLAASPQHPNFNHALHLADRALTHGARVFLYCIDDAVLGIHELQVQQLKRRGLSLLACAYGARRRNLPLNDQAVFCGLTVLSDLIAETDRFLCLS
jgi:sulfur relay (sulfurtransferase) complex TusBCD TusD component (DsrE family)